MTSISGLGGSSALQFMRMPVQREQPDFGTIESDGNKSVSLEEFKSGAPGGAGRAGADQGLDKLFGAIDSDGDGGITESEFDAFAEQAKAQFQSFQLQVQQLDQQDGLASLFEALDSDADGGVSRAEFGGGASETGGSQLSELLDELFRQIDQNGDESISQEENDAFLKQVEERRQQAESQSSLSTTLLNAARDAYRTAAEGFGSETGSSLVAKL